MLNWSADPRHCRCQRCGLDPISVGLTRVTTLYIERICLSLFVLDIRLYTGIYRPMDFYFPISPFRPPGLPFQPLHPPIDVRGNKEKNKEWEREKKKEKLLLISLHTGSLYVCTAAIRSLSPPPVDVEHIDDVWIGRPADYYGSSSNSS